MQEVLCCCCCCCCCSDSDGANSQAIRRKKERINIDDHDRRIQCLMKSKKRQAGPWSVVHISHTKTTGHGVMLYTQAVGSQGMMLSWTGNPDSGSEEYG